MGKTLIIAEKPSQAREYAKTLGVQMKKDGYLEDDEYIITWCVGHLFELERPESYMDIAKVGTRWGVHRLPILPKPHEFKHRLKSGTQKQYQTVARLLKLPEVNLVICGTDADREGQLLFQEVWDHVGCQKPLFRLWISSLTAAAIREGLAKLRSAQEVEGLASAGYGRSFADWDFGMNLTEGFSALFGSFDPVRKKPNVISIGRVQTPTLALVVEREMDIQNFIPLNYIEIEAKFSAEHGKYKGKWFDPALKKSKETKPDLYSRDENGKLTVDKAANSGTESSEAASSPLTKKRAEEIIAKVKEHSGHVESLKEKEVSEPHPLLFDLTSLTVMASRRFSFGADKVLKIAQSLYEKKAITYPRTDCNYLPQDMVSKLKDHLTALTRGPHTQWAQEALKRPLPTGKRVINEITAHHAIIPTTETVNSEKLTPDEQKIWDLITLRFLSVWFPPARYQETEVITEVQGEHFLSKGKVLLDLGWKKVEVPPKSKANKNEDGNDETQQNLPLLTKHEKVLAEECSLLEKETKPPKRYTQGELLKAMEGAGKAIEDEHLRQQLKGKGLGTVATRPAILENLIERGYLVQEQKSLCPTEKGTGLIRLIKERLPQARLLVSAEMTGQMEYELGQVERKEIPLSHYLNKVEIAIRAIIEELCEFEKSYGKQPISCAPLKKKSTSQASDNPTNGKKPRTTKAEAATKVKIEKPLKSAKTKKASEADLSMPENRVSKTKNSHGSSQSQSTDDSAELKQEILGSCPNCGGGIIEGQKGFGCQNWRQGCKFVLWKTPICGKVLTKTQVSNLLKKGKTPLIKGFKSKSGKSFSAYLIWKDLSAGTLAFAFPENKEESHTDE